MLLSICIPTYNRAKELQRLLCSIPLTLSQQLEVVICDDGSSDSTPDLVREWVDKQHLRIQYQFQPNLGRGTALRNAVLAAKGEFIVIMDSDDWFVPRSLETVVTELQALAPPLPSPTGRAIVGVVTLTVGKDGQVLGDPFPHDRLITNLLAIRADHRVRGDKKEIVRADILKRVMYTVHRGEPRVPTSVLWARIAMLGDCVFLNLPLAGKVYLPDGMSANLLPLRLRSRRSSQMVYWEILRASRSVYRSLPFRLRAAANFWRFKPTTHYLQQVASVPAVSVFALIVGLPLGILLVVRDRILLHLVRRRIVRT